MYFCACTEIAYICIEIVVKGYSFWYIRTIEKKAWLELSYKTDFLNPYSHLNGNPADCVNLTTSERDFSRPNWVAPRKH